MPASKNHKFVGRVLGNYQIEYVLGYSQWGAACLARHRLQGQRSMLTILKAPGGLADREWETRFAQEAATLIRFTHPHILPSSDFGIQPGYVYLVTDFVKDPSLAQTLQSQGYFPAQQIVPLLHQIASGLDYVHSYGITHGMLSPSHLLMSSTQTVRIAGLGLRTMLEGQRNPDPAHQGDHLLNTKGVFLGNPAYIAPEQVQGRPIDARTDLYSLGIILFELLSGTLPFNGTDPLEIAQQRLYGIIPSIHSRQPQMPEELEGVVRKMLDLDPNKRYQRASEAAHEFENKLTLLSTTKRASVAKPMPKTIPPTSHWFDASEMAQSNPLPNPSTPISATTMARMQASAQADQNARSLEGMDPFEWWSTQSSGTLPAFNKPDTSSQPVLKKPDTAALRPVRLPDAPDPGTFQPRKINQGRRKLVTTVVAGSTASILTVAGLSFAHLLQSVKQSPSQSLTASMSGHGTATVVNGGQTPTTKATTVPQTGTKIGTTALAKNSSLMFTNPQDGVSSLLLHLSTGQFVACERTCTHQGVPVNYDPASGMLVCPAHGAVFNPKNGFSHVSGPGQGPLTAVKIQTSGNGTITTG